MKLQLKSYWGEVTEVFVSDIRVSRSIYACDEKYYVSGRYLIPNTNCFNSCTLGVFNSFDEASEYLKAIQLKEILQ